LRILDVRIRDIPFLRNLPVEHGSSRRDLVALERDVPSEKVYRLADSISGDAPANREDLSRERINVLADAAVCSQRR